MLGPSIFVDDPGRVKTACHSNWRGATSGAGNDRLHSNRSVGGLAVTTASRAEALPGVPTLSDFVPGYEASQWYGLSAPRKTPAAVFDKLNKELNAALADRRRRRGSRSSRWIRMTRPLPLLGYAILQFQRGRDLAGGVDHHRSIQVGDFGGSQSSFHRQQHNHSIANGTSSCAKNSRSST